MEKTAEMKAVMAKMDEGADLARTNLTDLIVKYPDAAEAFGKWAAEHKTTAGYKRLGQIMVALG